MGHNGHFGQKSCKGFSYLRKLERYYWNKNVGKSLEIWFLISHFDFINFAKRLENDPLCESGSETNNYSDFLKSLAGMKFSFIKHCKLAAVVAQR